MTPRGWSGLHAANDVVFRLSGITGTRTGEITRKMGYGDGFGFSFQFELAQTEVGKDEQDGVPVTTCVVARALPKPDAAQAAQLKTSKRSQREFDAAFAEAIAPRGEDSSRSTQRPGARRMGERRAAPLRGTMGGVSGPAQKDAATAAFKRRA